MYQEGKGQIINRSEYLRWKFRDHEQAGAPIQKAYFFKIVLRSLGYFAHRGFVESLRPIGQMDGSRSLLANAISRLFGRDIASRSYYLRYEDSYEASQDFD